jgi:hypothetical protein
MKYSLSLVTLGMVLACVTVFDTGCVTQAVWQKSSYQPAKDPRLSLAHSAQKNDLLVCYEEECTQSGKIRSRAYWLFSYNLKDTNVLNSPKPEFVDPDTFTDLSPVLMLDGRTARNHIPTNIYCARLEANQHSFTLCRGGAECGTYNLPFYSSAPLTPFWRAAVTPVAVTADAAIAATVVIVWIGMNGGFSAPI